MLFFFVSALYDTETTKLISLFYFPVTVASLLFEGVSRVEYTFQSAILKMMSNQVEVNNNTIDVESRVVDGGLQSAEEEGNLLKNKFEEEQDGVYDEKVESSCLNIGGKVEEPEAVDAFGGDDRNIARISTTIWTPSGSRMGYASAHHHHCVTEE